MQRYISFLLNTYLANHKSIGMNNMYCTKTSAYLLCNTHNWKIQPEKVNSIIAT